ncbi:hypothetical protein ACFLZG_05575 [Thermodesulfobacteriota bacterium]
MEEKKDYAAMGLRALRRAAKKVYEDARRNNIKVPVWRNNRVEYIEPTSEIISELSKPEN